MIIEHLSVGLPPWRLSPNPAYQALGAVNVSVIISLYNYSNYIRDCFESLVASIRFDPSVSVEVIVIDDASTDDGALVLLAASLACRDIPLLLVQRRQNAGLSHARNLGLSLSRGMAAFMLDADNTVKPACVATLYRCLSVTGAAAAYCRIEKFCASDGTLVGTISDHSFDLHRLLAANYIDAMAMFSVSALFGVGLYDVGMVYGWEDYDIWLAFGFAGLRVENVDDVLASYRVHADSMLNHLTEHALEVGRYLYAKYQQSLPQLAADSTLFGSPVGALREQQAPGCWMEPAAGGRVGPEP